jgi:rod shape-determining protein MreC
VLLLTDPDFGVAVRMVKVRATGVAVGQAGVSSLNVLLGGPIAPKKRPRHGEIAETSGLQGATFPPGIPVGTVDRVAVSDDGLSINARVIPLVDTADLEYVKVLLWNVGSPVPPALHATTTTPTTTTTTRPTTTSTTSKSTTPST